MQTLQGMSKLELKMLIQQLVSGQLEFYSSNSFTILGEEEKVYLSHHLELPHLINLKQLMLKLEILQLTHYEL